MLTGDCQLLSCVCRHKRITNTIQVITKTMRAAAQDRTSHHKLLSSALEHNQLDYENRPGDYQHHADAIASAATSK